MSNMNRGKIGIRLESLALPLRRALEGAGRLGATGVQVDAVGDLSPNTLSQTGRREFRHLLRAHNLELTALGCPLRHGLDIAENQEARIDHVKKVLALSFDLGPRCVIVQAGQVPQDLQSPPALQLSEALLALGHYGDRTGTTLTLDTGLESGDVLAQFLARFDTGGLGVNLNPANLLIHGFDPIDSARALRGRIVHVHAMDARRASTSRTAQEVPLGHGDIDWMEFLGVLEEIEYRAWITIVRESGTNRLADVAAGVAFLRQLGLQ
jgi:sugar phosphate isomerase/epimerase